MQFTINYYLLDNDNIIQVGIKLEELEYIFQSNKS